MVGIVFSGGGGKGAYEIGVWKALKKYGIDKEIIAVSGTSIGALNSVLFVNGNYELAVELWQNLEQSQVFHMTIERWASLASRLALPNIPGVWGIISNMLNMTKGIFSREALMEIINTNIDLDRIRRSDIKCFVTCCNAKTHACKVFDLGEYSIETIKKILCASSAIPFLFDDEKIEGEFYFDGGVSGFLRNGNDEGDSNVPIQPLIDFGCSVIIVVNLSNGTVLKDQIINYGSARLLNIFPSEDLGGLIDGTLNFDRESIIKKIELGYRDASAVFGKLKSVREILKNNISNVQKIELLERDLKMSRIKCSGISKSLEKTRLLIGEKNERE